VRDGLGEAPTPIRAPSASSAFLGGCEGASIAFAAESVTLQVWVWFGKALLDCPVHSALAAPLGKQIAQHDIGSAAETRPVRRDR